jgi:demethoxyubiquinone hydroxylase (CLK1/Coq7/Cat5 family)
MRNHEQQHVEVFNKLVVERRARPSVLMPIFNMGAYAMGMLLVFVSSIQLFTL